MSTIGELRDQYITKLEELSEGQRFKEIEQFILDMMDLHEQTDEEYLYIDLLNAYEEWSGK